ncbi:MAG: AAA family ATPase [Chloroflexi bacterium]|nr:AAA family ATPase [Chloroflexota bacterium]MBU1750724.1 AAA family ATPase [Chloroflexota bacterium]
MAHNQNVSAVPVPLPPQARRIVVVGVTGSGKTTLAGQLARRLGISHVELDAIHWGPNWTPATVDDFRERTAQALAGDAWVTDGNYSKVRDIVWGRADTVVWLDYALPVVLGQLVRRTLRRVVTQEELWNDNRETWRGVLFSRDSIVMWAFKTYRRRRREYPLLFQQPAYAHLTVVRLRSPRSMRRWLAGIPDRAR